MGRRALSVLITPWLVPGEDVDCRARSVGEACLCEKENGAPNKTPPTLESVASGGYLPPSYCTSALVAHTTPDPPGGYKVNLSVDIGGGTYLTASGRVNSEGTALATVPLPTSTGQVYAISGILAKGKTTYGATVTTPLNSPWYCVS